MHLYGTSKWNDKECYHLDWTYPGGMIETLPFYRPSERVKNNFN